MMKKTSVCMIVSIVLMSCSVISCSPGGKELKRPNLLFIMSDDHCANAIGVYGSRLANLNPTPIIDKLANEGIVMDNVFCTNSICTPSRAAILTGQYGVVSGVNGFTPLPAERQYLSIELRKNGYQTAVIGKWHLNNRPENFDYFKVLWKQGQYFDPVFFETGAKGVIEVGPRTYGPDAIQEKGHSTDVITDSGLDWLKNKRDPNKPFLLKLHYKAPHSGFDYAPRYESYLEDVDIPEPETLWSENFPNRGSIATRGHNDELIRYIGRSIGRRHLLDNYVDKLLKKDAPESDEEAKRQAYQVYLKKYLRCVKGIDDNVKRVLDYLKEEGLYDNTVVMYTGDQGFFLGERDLYDKRWGYEESMKMPFIVRYPKSIKAGIRSDAIVENVDFAPTMLDFAGVPTPDYMQGRSFKSILETGKEPEDWKKAAYYHYASHMASYAPAHIAIRTKRHKLILFYGAKGNSSVPDTPPAWELYDMQKDPSEMNNLYDNPEYVGVIADLKNQLRELRRKYKADGDHPKFTGSNKIIEEYWDYDEENRKKAIEISNNVLEQIKSGDWKHDRTKPKTKKK
jgi:arylsulfatase A-like enzyme